MAVRLGCAGLELERATPQVEHGTVAGAAPDHLRQGIEVPAAVLLHVEQPRLAKNPQVLRRVAGGQVQPPGDLPDLEPVPDQQTDDANAGVFAQRSEGRDTVARINDGEKAPPVWPANDLCRGGFLTGSTHGVRTTFA